MQCSNYSQWNCGFDILHTPECPWQACACASYRQGHWSCNTELSFHDLICANGQQNIVDRTSWCGIFTIAVWCALISGNLNSMLGRTACLWCSQACARNGDVWGKHIIRMWGAKERLCFSWFQHRKVVRKENKLERATISRKVFTCSSCGTIGPKWDISSRKSVQTLHCYFTSEVPVAHIRHKIQPLISEWERCLFWTRRDRCLSSCTYI